MIGRSNIVGIPVSLLLIQARALLVLRTTSIVIHSASLSIPLASAMRACSVEYLTNCVLSAPCRGYCRRMPR